MMTSVATKSVSRPPSRISLEGATAGRYISRRDLIQFAIPDRLSVLLVLVQMSVALSIHRRNRSNDELEDYVLPGEVPWVKRVVYYLLISGLFWLLLPLSSIVVAMIPRSRMRIPNPDDDAGAFRKSIQFLNGVKPGRVRRDLLVTFAVWATAFPVLHPRWTSVAVCYAAFGFSWASQQYIYHVRTPRHAVLGALDLKLPAPVRWFYLNFNYHGTQHLAVWVPWTHLPSIAAQQPQQGYLSTYFQLWRPPERLEDAWPANYQVSGQLPSTPERKSELA